jgi:hypothetical protein
MTQRKEVIKIRGLKPNTGPPILLMVTFFIFVSFGGMSEFRLFYLAPDGGVRYEE